VFWIAKYKSRFVVLDLVDLEETKGRKSCKPKLINKYLLNWWKGINEYIDYGLIHVLKSILVGD
jgi:hypothetical protein